MRTTRFRGRAALAVTVVMVVTACTGGGPQPDGPSGSPSTEAAPDGPAPTAPSGAPDAAEIPVEQLLDAFELAGPESDEDTLAATREFQEAVARCMTDKGFEYTPDVPDQVSTGSPSPAPDEEEQWRATWGFGISIDDSALYADVVTDRPDPNADYVASLSPAGREAYDVALTGTELLPGEDPHAPGRENGCYVEVQEQMLVDDPVPAQPDLVTELWRQATATTYDRMSTDQRMAEAIDTLVQCAVDAGAVGYDGTPTEGHLYGGFGDSMHPPTYEPWSAIGQVSAAWDELTAAGEPSPDELARFQQWERDLAVAEYRCNAPVFALATQIHTEALRDVVAPHRTELENLLATWPNG